MSRPRSRYGFWVRFVCSLIGFSLMFGFIWLFYSDWSEEAGALCGVAILVTSYLSARYGDRAIFGILETFVGNNDKYRGL